MRTKYPLKLKDDSVLFKSMWVSAKERIPPVLPEGTEILIHDNFTKKVLQLSAEYVRKQLLKAKAHQIKNGFSQQRYFVSHWMIIHKPR